MGEPARILTIEDEQPVRSGIVVYLQESGFSVLEATDGLRRRTTRGVIAQAWARLWAAAAW